METLEYLLDLEQIRQLKYRYFRSVDTKNWDGVASCFVPEATANYPQCTCAGRGEIIAFLSGVMHPGLASMHQGHHPEITVDGDTATGYWHLHDRVLIPEFTYSMEGAAIYTDRYVRTDEGWLMSHTGYERLFETSMSTDGLGRYRIVQGALSKGPGNV